MSLIRLSVAPRHHRALECIPDGSHFYGAAATLLKGIGLGTVKVLGRVSRVSVCPASFDQWF